MIRKLFFGLAAVLLVGMVTVTPLALADSATTSNAQSQEVATQTYGTDDYLQKGSIVTLKAGDANKVVLATAKTLNQMIGIVVAPSDSALTLSNPKVTTNLTYVATSGRYDVLVSNQGGAIKAGDYITVSAVDGVGMKTGSTQGLVLGTAAGGFAGTTDAIASVVLKDSSGKDIKTSIGLIPIDINIGQNPFLDHQTGGVPKSLDNLSRAITGKPVSAVKVYSGLAILLAATSVAVSVLYAGIRGSFVAIGRNPLARSSIIRGMIQVVVTAMIIFTFGLSGVYLILKL